MMLETDAFEILKRKVIATPDDTSIYIYPVDQLRTIADRFKMKKRRKFYRLATKLAIYYYYDQLSEDDLLGSSRSRKVFCRSAKISLRLLEASRPIFEDRATFSLWNEPYFTSEGYMREIALKFRRDEFQEQLAAFMALTVHAASELPEAAPSRKKTLALRKWALGHLLFWRDDLERPITVCNDRRDGQSEAHRFLADLLHPIDPSSVPKLGTVLRDLSRSLREETKPR